MPALVAHSLAQHTQPQPEVLLRVLLPLPPPCCSDPRARHPPCQAKDSVAETIQSAKDSASQEAGRVRVRAIEGGVLDNASVSSITQR